MTDQPVNSASGSDSLAIYASIIEDPQRTFTPRDTRANYAACFESGTCPKCSTPIESENTGIVDGVLHLVCEKCWTVFWIGESETNGQAYPVTISAERALSELEAAELAVKLLEFAQTCSVDMYLLVDEDLFPGITNSSEGWFRACLLPLSWDLDYQDDYDADEIAEFKAMDFAEKIETARSYMDNAMQDYGWSDNQDGFDEIFSKITLDTCALSVEVGDWDDI